MHREKRERTARERIEAREREAYGEIAREKIERGRARY